MTRQRNLNFRPWHIKILFVCGLVILWNVDGFLTASKTLQSSYLNSVQLEYHVTRSIPPYRIRAKNQSIFKKGFLQISILYTHSFGQIHFKITSYLEFISCSVQNNKCTSKGNINSRLFNNSCCYHALVQDLFFLHTFCPVNSPQVNKSVINTDPILQQFSFSLLCLDTHIFRHKEGWSLDYLI